AMVTVTSVALFAAPTSLAVTGLPSGVSASFSQTSVTPSPGAPATSTLTLSISGTAPAGPVSLTVTGTSGALTHTSGLTLIVTAPDFTLGVSPGTLTVGQGQTKNATVTVGSINGFSSAVGLALSGVPAGVTASLSSTSLTPPAGGNVPATLTLMASPSAPPGPFTITISGTAGGLAHGASLALTVTPPDLTIRASAASVALPPRGSAS